MNFIKIHLFIFLILISFTLNAHTIRFDVNIDYNTKFKPEMGKRLQHSNTLTFIDQNILLYTNNWKMTNGEAISPLSIHYLINAGVGKFLVGLTYSKYNYIGFYNSYNDLIKNYLEKKIDNYEQKIQTYEIGYEFNIIENLIMTVAMGNKNLNREIKWHGFTSVSNNFYGEDSSVSTNSNGLYQKIKLEYFFIPNMSVFIQYSFGILKGNVNYQDNIFTSSLFSFVNSIGWKNNINFNEAIVGVNFKINEFSKIKVAAKQLQYMVSYDNTYIIFNSVNPGSIFQFQLPAIWSKYFDDTRTSFLVGYEYNLNF
jgi:hypothetical protein